MKRHHLFAALIASSPLAGASTGPVVHGPDNVYETYPLSLDPGEITSGNWTIDWGDQSPVSTVPVSQTTVNHTYPSTGSYEISAILKDGSGKVVDSQYAYHALVRKTGPSAHYLLENPSGTGDTGAPLTGVGIVTTVPSFSRSAGNAVRLAAGAYLKAPDLAMKDADFFGLEFWLKPSDLTTRQVVFAGTGNADGNVRVYIENNRLCFNLMGSGVIKSVPFGYGVEAGRWYQFAVSYERSPYFRERNVLRFYRDGFLLAEQSYTASQALAVNYSGATIGTHNTGTMESPSLQDPLSGDIDEIVLHPLGVFPGAFLERYRAATSNRSVFRISSGEDGAPDFTVSEPVITDNVTVELDPDPEVDNAPTIRTAINAAAAGTRIKFIDRYTGLGGGTYYLKSAVSGSHVGRVIVINSKTDLEIDGNGVNFLVSSHYTRFIESIGSTRVAVKNVSFDIDQSVGRSGAYAQLESIDKNTGKVKIRWVKGAAKEPDVVPGGFSLWRWRRVDGTTRTNLSGVNGWNITSKTPDPTDGSLWTLQFSTSSHPSGDGIWTEFESMKAAGDLIQVNGARFLGSGVYAQDCTHLTLDRFHLYGFTGMGILVEKSDYVKVTHSKIGLPPGLTALDRPFSTGSDGFHFHNSKTGRLLFENNDIGMTDDDPISLKDQVVIGAKKVAANQLKHGGLWTGPMELRQTDLLPLDPPFTATATSYNSSTDIATFNAELPGEIGDQFHVLKRYQYSGQYILRGNNVHDLNGRMMVYTPDGTIENNRFSRLWFHIGFSAADHEGSGEPYNIVVANNLFDRGGRNDAAPWGVAPSTPIIDDIGISNNSFMQSYWISTYSAGPNFTNNYVERSEGKKDMGYFNVVYNTTHAKAFGNIHYDPQTSLTVTTDGSSSLTQGSNEIIPPRSTAADVIVDNTSATYMGNWSTSSVNTGQFNGSNYRWSNTSGSTAQFTPAIPVTGTYRVYAMWNGGTDRGSTVPFTITHAGGIDTVHRSQKTGGGLWVYLGTYTFNGGGAGNVRISKDGAGGLVIADAVRFQQ